MDLGSNKEDKEIKRFDMDWDITDGFILVDKDGVNILEERNDV